MKMMMSKCFLRQARREGAKCKKGGYKGLICRLGTHQKVLRIKHMQINRSQGPGDYFCLETPRDLFSIQQSDTVL